MYSCSLFCWYVRTHELKMKRKHLYGARGMKKIKGCQPNKRNMNFVLRWITFKTPNPQYEIRKIQRKSFSFFILFFIFLEMKSMSFGLDTCLFTFPLVSTSFHSYFFLRTIFNRFFLHFRWNLLESIGFSLFFFMINER